MAINLTEQLSLTEILKQIDSEEEKSRRAYANRRHKIYRDGGRQYLIEALEAEFGKSSRDEFRLCPINFLKTIVEKKSRVYRQGAIRRSDTGLDSDQTLIDHYTEELSFDETMGKANRYYNLHSNCALYTFPFGDTLRLTVVPPQLYSIVPNSIDANKVDVWVFNNFKEEDQTAQRLDLMPNGPSGFMRDRSQFADGVDKQARMIGEPRKFIVWTDQMHVTSDEMGRVALSDPDRGDDQFMNPIGVSPVYHLQKDTDNEAWATQGEDAVDIALLLQKTWTDLMTIIKHQGFGQLVITSDERPTRMTIGINKVLWLKKFEGRDAPSVEYLTADSRISEIKETIRDLTFLLLTTNDINPQGVGKADGGSTFNSGIQAMLEMSDAIESMKSQQPVLRDAEKETWDRVKRWHNFMFDTGQLNDKARSLGRFSEDFGVQVIFRDPKPLESEVNVLDRIERKRAMKMMSKKDAMKELHPDMTDEQIEAKLEEINDESQKTRDMFGIGPMAPQTPQKDEEETA